ncbi:MAG TPA: hypothetical protein G4O14_11075 [Anaerolineae bacterium]|nr:hypothetical protein [Anaerolineae bacterium]
MGEDNLHRLRRELRDKSSEAYIETLKGLRDELASRRWELILEIDGIRELLFLAIAKAEDPDLKGILAQANSKLDHVEQSIARIPDDFIPAF